MTLHDPGVDEDQRKELATEPGAKLSVDLPGALEGRDAVLIPTVWPEYRDLDPAEFKRRMRRPVVIDGRNIFDPGRMRELGIDYRGVSR